MSSAAPLNVLINKVQLEWMLKCKTPCRQMFYYDEKVILCDLLEDLGPFHTVWADRLVN